MAINPHALTPYQVVSMSDGRLAMCLIGPFHTFRYLYIQVMFSMCWDCAVYVQHVFGMCQVHVQRVFGMCQAKVSMCQECVQTMFNTG